MTCRLKISTLEDIWDILLVGCVSLDADGGHWTRSNDRTTEFLGYADSELSRKSLSSVTDPNDWAVEETLMEKILLGHSQGYSMSKQFLTRDGRRRWARVQADKVTPDDGTPFLIYQIMPGEVELRGDTVPPSVSDYPKKNSAALLWIKSNWKTLGWFVGSLVMLFAKGYHAVETWRQDQETRVESLTQDVQQINANIEILIKNLDK
jgi:PAS domain S-box-containing protein